MVIDKKPDSRSIVTERVEPLVCPTCGLVIKSKKVGDGTVYIDIDWTGYPQHVKDINGEYCLRCWARYLTMMQILVKI